MTSGPESITDDPESIRLRKMKEQDMVPLEELEPELMPLIAQFRNHLESMKANAAQVAGIGDAISSTTTALNDAFYQRGGRDHNNFVFEV